MSDPVRDPGTSYAVICHTCGVNVWQGDELLEEDGQVLLTVFAESVSGTGCPSKVDSCPHKTAALENAQLSRPVRLAELEALRARLATVEAKLPNDPVAG
ncbi:MAG: hypothetical protein ACREX8_11770 [Gammaproteobacteria bacterium]